MVKGTATALALAVMSIGAMAQTDLRSSSADRIDLSGEWGMSMNPAPTGKSATKVTLPASLTELGIGDIVTTKTRWVGSLYDSSYFFNPKMEAYRRDGSMKIPFFLTPESHYIGEVTYTKSVTIPKSWKGRRVEIILERPHISSTMVINGKTVGSYNSLSVAHRYDIGKHVNYGKANKIEIKIENDPWKVGVGIDSHSVTDQTQGCWNGIVGSMEIVCTDKSDIEQLSTYPNIKDKSVRVAIKTTEAVNGVTLTARLINSDKQQEVSRHYTLSGLRDTLTLSLGAEAEMWDEFNPALYELTAKVDGNRSASVTTFGLREIRVEGDKIMLNGHKVMLRGTVENCDFPLTGYPPTDLESWLEVFRTCKRYGLNHMRFHSYCPPEAAFEAADLTGFYLQPEGPSWPNHGVSLGRGEIIDTYLMEETERMVEAYGNHASFTMLCAGNEPRGRWVDWVSKFVETWKARDARRIYTGASVGGGWQWQPKSEYHVKAGARGLAWDRERPGTMDNFANGIKHFYDKATKSEIEIKEPFVAHEMGQWCAFPDLEETDQYTGAYKARNFEVFGDLLRTNGMGSMAHKFLMSSGKLQTLCYKYEMERLLRTPNYAGFQLLGLNDYSGQGTALVGVTNVFFREKGYCTAEDFREFCSPVTPLAEMPKFVYNAGEEATVTMLLTNYAENGLKEPVDVEVTDASGKRVEYASYYNKEGFSLGVNRLEGFSIKLPTETDKAQKYTIRAKVGERYTNHWDYWVYPKEETTEPSNVLVTDTLDDKAIATLKAGGRVLLCAAGKVRFGRDVKQTYLPVFWNTSWFKMRPPHTTGSYINKHHPALRDFPTDDWTELQWWELVNKAQTMQLSEMPSDLKPIVEPIDTWFVSRKLGTLFEARVLGGRLMMTSLDITSDLTNRPVARQLRKSLLNYMTTEGFRPQVEIDVELIKDIFRKDAPILDMYTKDSPDELKPKFN